MHTGHNPVVACESPHRLRGVSGVPHYNTHYETIMVWRGEGEVEYPG